MYDFPEYFDADVVIVGGGLAGSMAALQARKAGASVIVLDSADPMRSGSAGAGVDHLFCYVPPVHEKMGYSREDMKQDLHRGPAISQGYAYGEFTDFFVEHSFERIMSLEQYGVRLRYEDHTLSDGFRLMPQFHPIPATINFDGRDIKPKLTLAMQGAGVRILPHRAAVEILLDENGAAAGVIAISGRDETLSIIRAKATILATAAGAGRLGENTNTTHRHLEWPSRVQSGFGISLPMRAGAEVVNLELSILNGGLSFAGFNFTAAAPGGSWWPAARVVNDHGEVVVDRVVAYSLDTPDYLRKNREQFRRYMQQNKSMVQRMAAGEQLYVDLQEATDEEIAYIKWSISNEGRGWLFLRNAEHEGMDFRQAKIPFRLNHNVRFKAQSSGVLVDRQCESTVKNLFAAGDAVGASASGAASGAIVFGWEAGVQAAKRAASISELPVPSAAQLQAVQARLQRCRCSDGTSWDQQLRRLQNVCALFGVFPINDTKCNHALQLIRSMKETAAFSAADPHETLRCFEVFSLLDAAEAIFSAALLRRHSLGSFRREDDATPAPEKTQIYGLYYTPAGEVAHNCHVPADGISEKEAL